MGIASEPVIILLDHDHAIVGRMARATTKGLVITSIVPNPAGNGPHGRIGIQGGRQVGSVSDAISRIGYGRSGIGRS